MYIQDDSHIWQFDISGKYDKIGTSFPSQSGNFVNSISAYAGKTFIGYETEILPGNIGDYIPDWDEYVNIPIT